MRGVNPAKKYVNLGKVTTGFGGSTEQEPFHPGIDIANSEGTPIKAPVDGVVTRVDNSHIGIDNSFGNTLELKDSEGKVHQFHHLQKSLAKPGQQVRKGQPVAALGATGAVYSPSNSNPANLDYRIVDSFNRYVNPTQYARQL